jgi:hypothetical protein
MAMAFSRSGNSGWRRLGAAIVLAACSVGLSLAVAGPASAVPAPKVTGLTPAFGLPAGGTTVAIAGNNLLGVTAVSFGTKAATSFTGPTRSVPCRPPAQD